MMNAGHRNLLNTHRLALVRGLTVSETLVSFLRQDYTLTDEMQQEIMGRPTNGDRVGRLLDILVKRGPNAFGQFIQALVLTDQDNMAVLLDKVTAFEYIQRRDEERSKQPPVAVQPFPPGSFTSSQTMNAGIQPGGMSADMQYLLSLQQQSLIQQQQMMPQTQIIQHLLFQQLQQQLQSSNANSSQPSIGGQGAVNPGQNFSQVPLASNGSMNSIQNSNPLQSHVSNDGSMSSLTSTASGRMVEQPTDDIEVLKNARVENQAVPCSDDIDQPIVDPSVSTDLTRSVSSDMKRIAKEIENFEPEMKLQVHQATNFADVVNLMRMDEIYPVRSDIRGRAVIISNIEFMKLQLHTRTGSDIDVINLTALFTGLQFQVEVHPDKTKKEILDILQNENTNTFHRSADMFVLCILSHGSQGSIYGTDGEEIEIDKIMEQFDGKNCPALKDKPKLFFIQACQGRAMTVGDRHQTDGMYETDVDMEPPRDDRPGEHLNDNLVKTLEKLCIEDKEGFVTGRLVHEKADTLVAYATVKGYRAWRRTDLGSWFVRCIVYVFSTRACTDQLTDLLTKVNNIMSHMKVDDPGKPKYKQIAEKKDTLRKKVYFFPGYKGPASSN